MGGWIDIIGWRKGQRLSREYGERKNGREEKLDGGKHACGKRVTDEGKEEKSDRERGKTEGRQGGNGWMEGDRKWKKSR